MPRLQLSNELEKLHNDLLKLGNMVENAILDSIKSLKNQDIRLANKVVHGDEIINSLEEEIGDKCIKLIATQHPMEIDLIDIPRMADLAIEMVKKSLEALIKKDIVLAKETWALDETVDDIYKQIHRELLTYMMEDPKKIIQSTYFLFICSHIERIADYAKNVCEKVVFIQTGEYSRK